MPPRPARVAARYLSAREPLNLAHYGLEGLMNGTPVTLYHGTTASFTRFDLNKSRTELVERVPEVVVFDPRKVRLTHVEVT